MNPITMKWLFCPFALWTCTGWANTPASAPGLPTRVPSGGSPSMPAILGKMGETPPRELDAAEDDALRPGLKAEAALRVFLGEHPRWMEEEHGPPRLRRLLDQTLDAYLRIVWNGAARAPVAARALWNAHQVAALCGDTARATHFAEDLTRSHPNSPYAQNAFLFLQRQPPRNTLPEILPPGSSSNPAPVREHSPSSRRGSSSP